MISGSCLCEGVRYEVLGRLTPIQFCHCSRCRKASGSAFRAGVACRASAFRWLSGVDLIAHYSLPPKYRRAFCRVCGSQVPFVEDGEQYALVPAGSLDGDPGTRPLRHVFVGSKAPWFEIGDALPQFVEDAPPEQRLPLSRPVVTDH